MVYWLRIRNRPTCTEGAQRELRRTFLIASTFCVGVSLWTLQLFGTAGAEHRLEFLVFAGLAAIGAGYAMTCYPAVAKVPLLLLTLPLAVTVAFDGEVAHAAMGISLIILVVLKHRLIELHDRDFVRLVYSRFAIEAEKRRAVDAERVALDEQLRVARIANSDPLTGLANRRGFLAFLEQLSGAEWKQALILFDLDGFKPINDTFGHPAGDALLIEVSQRLQGLDRGGSIARLGGDEFALLCDCADQASAMQVAKRAVEVISDPFIIGGRKMVISACAGVSVQTADELADAMLRADVALYSAKRSGRGKVAIFSNAMQQKFKRRTSIEQALRDPGLADSIDLAFQPIYDLGTMELRSFEALARWRHSELGWIPPSEFIPITEQISLLEDMSNALLRRAARAARRWPCKIRLSFNLSATQLCSPGTATDLLSIIADEGLPSTRLQIEVTETALLADFEVARQNLSQLRDEGVGIVLDDFGAGYSSISYLREMSFDTVKLDGSLISSITRLDSGLPLLRGVLALCQAMGQQCVAEHIETERELALLRRLGCRYGQGYLLSPPVDVEEALALTATAQEKQPRSLTA
jgi:diguanylate cyclase (GGDEF)-like protein